MARQTFLASCPTCHRLIFVSNFAISVASILLTILSVIGTLCQRLGVANFDRQSHRAKLYTPTLLFVYNTKLFYLLFFTISTFSLLIPLTST
jgi:hypothetical protein